MAISPSMFRNVDGSPDDPVPTWHPEVFTAVLSYGGLPEYRPVIREIMAHPWGVAALTVEEILSWADPEDEDEPIDEGTWMLFRTALDEAHRRRETEERRDVIDELRSLVTASGLTAGDFALRCGTSASRFSTYMNGKVMPRADFMVRAKRLAGAVSTHCP